MDFQFKDKYDINDLLEIMRILRSENGCPWDREQDHKSIRKDFLEETYEVVEAIDADDKELLLEELGDVLLQVVFHSRIEEEKGGFDFDDVADGICQKLIVRHPHVFGDVNAETSGEVLKNWNNIKQQTKGQETFYETLESVCTALPALMRAQKIGQRAKRAGMDFKDVSQVLECLESEISELKEAVAGGKKENISDELGDVLFSCTNLARHLDCDAEESLTRSTDKFIKRFKETENLIRCEGTDMKSLNIDELDAYWRKAKSK